MSVIPLEPFPSFSIVIVCFGKREVTERCLRSLEDAYGARIGSDVELVLVDNASPDDTADLLRSWEGRATVLLLPDNRNFGGGNNLGAQAARGDVLVLLNNDTEVSAGALDELALQAREPGVGIAGCRLIYPNGAVQHGGCAWWQGPDGNVRQFHLFRHEAGDLAVACATWDCDVVTGACVAIRRELFLDLDGFDEGFVNGWEDVDLCVRARLAGHRVVYRGDVVLTHAEGMTRSRRFDESANERLFFSRYAGQIEDDSGRLAAQFGGSGPDFRMSVHPASTPEGSAISVEGEVTGLAHESAEARALLTALERCGLVPATRDWQTTLVKARLADDEWQPIVRAAARPVRRDALIVQAPVGRLGAVEPHPRAILRLASMPAVDATCVAAIWAAYPSLADWLVANGADPERVHVLPPGVPDVPVGPGGGGVLAAVPAHDPRLSAQLLTALGQLPSSSPIRLLPTVAAEPVVELAGGLASARGRAHADHLGGTVREPGRRQRRVRERGPKGALRAACPDRGGNRYGNGAPARLHRSRRSS